ncbi:MAG: FHA domain-containing protein, partial [Verrucomicrobium sp.]
MARIVFTLEDGTEIEAELDADVITIGRRADSIVVLPSSSVSSHHATIKQRGDSYYVQDLGTTNGTKLNGVEVEEARLEDGDQLMFGDIPAVFHLNVQSITRAVPVAQAPLPVPLAASAPVASKFATSRNAPPSLAPRRTTRPVQYQESSGCAGFLTFLVFLVLAFVVGLHVRHGVETGG